MVETRSTAKAKAAETQAVTNAQPAITVRRMFFPSDIVSDGHRMEEVMDLILTGKADVRVRFGVRVSRSRSTVW
jgi:hypothetical protein